jgi:hypothetical protein
MFIKAFGNGIQIRIILSGNISLTPWYEDLKTNLIQKAENWACIQAAREQKLMVLTHLQ